MALTLTNNLGVTVSSLLILSLSLLMACGSDSTEGPDPFRQDRYRILFLNTNSVPVIIWGGMRLDSAFLIPYGMGRTIDQRLTNDRTGRGGTGGNTRDTTIARGQFMDVRIFLGGGRDSTIVDMMVRDTVVIVTRPHPDPSRVRADTGWFADGRLNLPTLIDYRQKYPIIWPGLERPCPLDIEPMYTPRPCVYRTMLVYIWE